VADPYRRSASYEEIRAGLDDVFLLAQDLGLGEQARLCRFGRYRKLLDGLIHVVQDERAGTKPSPKAARDIEENVTEYRIALSEVRDIGLLMPVLTSIPSDVAKTKLSAVFSGPVLPSDEDSTSNHARNIQFELTLAALLKRAGYAPRLGEHPDLLVHVVDRDYVIECKRVFSAAKVITRIAEAGAQLHADRKNVVASTCGIVAISLSRFLGANDEAFRAPDEDIARRALETWLERAREAARPSYRALFAKYFVVAALFYTAASFRNLRTGTFDYGTQWSAESYVPPFAPYRRSLRTLQKSLTALAY
jgi:hypothetical protein